MKKTILFLLFAALCGSIYAAETENAGSNLNSTTPAITQFGFPGKPDSTPAASDTISQNRNLEEKAIDLSISLVDPVFRVHATRCRDMSDCEKLLYFSFNKKSPWPGFFMNLFLGFGIGSFVDGDTKSGITSVCLDAIGAGCILTGSLIASRKYEMTTGCYFLVVGGSICVLVSRILECIAPFKWAEKYNAELANAIFSSNVNISLIPEVNRDDHSKFGGITCTARISL